MTSSVPDLHNTKILNISGTSGDMTKRKTPFFFTFKGLSNTHIFQYLNFSFHRHFKALINDNKYFLVNVYGPNKDTEAGKFFQQLTIDGF